MQETLILQGFHELEKIGENAFADSGRRGRVFESRHSDLRSLDFSGFQGLRGHLEIGDFFI